MACAQVFLLKVPVDFLSKSTALGQEKNVLVLVIGRVDFDANKKKRGPQIKYDTEKNTESSNFFHLSIIGIHVHLHFELLHERFKSTFST